MSFFERAAVAAAAVPPPEHAPERATPVWFQAPRGVVPGQSDLQVVVFRTDQAVLVAGQFQAYPTGIEFTIELRLRTTNEALFDVPWQLDSRSLRRRRAGNAVPDEFLRLGFAFSDGRTWSNLGHQMPTLGEQPTGPVVVGRGGGGGGDSWAMGYWMWPLPQPPELVIYAEWPAFDVPETSAVIDTTSLQRVAARAQTIWP